MSKQTLYTVTAAAEYLGISVYVLRYHLYKSKQIQADHQIGHRIVFTRSTLDKFKRKYQAQGLTVAQAAAHLGVTKNWIENHVYVTKRLKPIGRRGKKHIFTLAAVEALRPLLADIRPASKVTQKESS